MFETCLALTLQCKNLYNTIHFAVRNVLTAYVWGGEAGCWRIKPELHAEQARAIACFNAVVESLNSDRQAKFAAAIAAGGEKAEKAKLTLLPVLGDEVQNLYRTVLDITVLDNVARQRPDQHGNVMPGPE
ncbi:hypothetical protein [Cupriavidus necator]